MAKVLEISIFMSTSGVGSAIVFIRAAWRKIKGTLNIGTWNCVLSLCCRCGGGNFPHSGECARIKSCAPVESTIPPPPPPKVRFEYQACTARCTFILWHAGFLFSRLLLHFFEFGVLRVADWKRAGVPLVHHVLALGAAAERFRERQLHVSGAEPARREDLRRHADLLRQRVQTNHR